jgi:hypothetical protein
MEERMANREQKNIEKKGKDERGDIRRLNGSMK